MAHIPTLCESGGSLLARLGNATISLGRNWRKLIPTHCSLCSAPARSGALCPPCHDLITSGMRGSHARCKRCCLLLGHHDTCPDCRINAPTFDRVIAAFDYVEPADLLIHRLKVARRFTEVPMLAGLLAAEVARVWPDAPSDLVVVPVPASRQAIKHRGFNPAADVGRAVARRLGLGYQPHILRRVRDGRKQAMLGRDARMMATSQLYQVAADVHGFRIAVVDDVMTTGSTMHSVARMLKRSGAASVHGLVIARTPHPKF